MKRTATKRSGVKRTVLLCRGKDVAVVNLAELRTAVADYMRSEGCSCCRDTEAHKKHEAILAKLLKVPRYRDGSGYRFERFRSKEPKR